MQQVFLAPCRLHLAHDARVLITTLVSGRHVHVPLWCYCLYFVSGQRQFAAGQRHLLLQRGLHGRQRRRLLRLPRRRLQGHLRCRARVLMFLARDQVPSPCSRAPMSRDITTHLGAGCARVAFFVSRYSRMSHTLQGLHTRACSPSMDMCIAGIDMSPCVLVLMIMPHQKHLYT